MNLKKAFETIKRLLGFAPPPPPPPKIPTKLELAEKAYANTPKEAQSSFLANQLTEAKKEVDSFIASNTNLILEKVDPQNAIVSRVKIALEWVDVWNFVLAKKGDGVAAAEQELLFSKLLALVALLGTPGKAIVGNLEGYAEKFEQNLLLAEARGEYACLQSENKAWVSLPLLQFLPSKKFDPKLPREELDKIFYEIPQMQILDFENKIPKFKTSLVDIQMYIADKKVVPLKTTNPEHWYLYIIH